MKIAILSMLITIPAIAQNWMPKSGIQAQKSAGYSLSSECEKVTGEKCLDVGEEPEMVAAGYVSIGADDALVKDTAGWELKKLSETQALALEVAISFAQGLRKCGERVMALMLVRNQPKNLSTAQVKQLVASYAGVKSLLESGSLVSAREEILAAEADGVLVTQADKAALAQAIDACLGQ